MAHVRTSRISVWHSSTQRFGKRTVPVLHKSYVIMLEISEIRGPPMYIPESCTKGHPKHKPVVLNLLYLSKA